MAKFWFFLVQTKIKFPQSGNQGKKRKLDDIPSLRVDRIGEDIIAREEISY